MPNQIKLSLEKYNKKGKEWEEENKLISLINFSINIEILKNQTTTLQKYIKNNRNKTIKFFHEEHGINNFLKTVKNYGQLYINNNFIYKKCPI